MARCQRGKLDPPAEEERIGADKQRLNPVADQSSEGGLDCAAVVRLSHADLDSHAGSRHRHVFRYRRGRRIIGIDQQSNPPGGVPRWAKAGGLPPVSRCGTRAWLFF
jgi:hypothetical protein